MISPFESFVRSTATAGSHSTCRVAATGGTGVVPPTAGEKNPAGVDQGARRNTHQAKKSTSTDSITISSPFLLS